MVETHKYPIPGKRYSKCEKGKRFQLLAIYIYINIIHQKRVRDNDEALIQLLFATPIQWMLIKIQNHRKGDEIFKNTDYGRNRIKNSRVRWLPINHTGMGF